MNYTSLQLVYHSLQVAILGCTSASHQTQFIWISHNEILDCNIPFLQTGERQLDFAIHLSSICNRSTIASLGFDAGNEHARQKSGMLTGVIIGKLVGGSCWMGGGVRALLSHSWSLIYLSFLLLIVDNATSQCIGIDSFLFDISPLGCVFLFSDTFCCADMRKDVWPILQQKAQGHIASADAPMFFGHSADAAYRALVNVSSVIEPEFYRVVPFDSERSYLVTKILGHHAEGSLMPPPGLPRLTPKELDIIQLWIDHGAPLDCQEIIQPPFETAAAPLLEGSGSNEVILGIKKKNNLFIRTDPTDVLIFMGTALLVLRM